MADDHMHEVLSGLYIGSAEAAYDTDCLKKHGVTHILSIESCQLSEEYTKDFTAKLVLALDMPENDLLSKFDECFKFIEQGLEKGGVLVHCLRGASRSAAVVIAYVMSKQKLSFREAMELVKSKRNMIDPNSGFVNQLQLFEKMGCSVDLKNDLYRRYKLSKLALAMQHVSNSKVAPVIAGVRSSGSTCDYSIFQAKAGSTHAEANPLLDLLNCNPSEGQDQRETIYKCRKCRKALFKQSGLISHVEGFGEAAFDWRGKLPTYKKPDPDIDQSDTDCNRSLFIEPVQWMADSIHVPEGKLSCPKCASKIGSFVWYGERCPCGSWVAPAFHIQTNKVDECKPRPLARIGIVGTTS